MLGVAVLVVAIIALRNPKQDATAAGSQTATTSRSALSTGSAAPSSSARHSSSPPRSPSTKPSTTHRSTGVGSQPLVVLNQPPAQNDVAAAAAKFRGGGWQVTSTDPNYINDVVTTTAYYDPNVPGAQAAAEALQRQFPAIRRVQERFSNLVPGPVVVVLTTDYAPS